MSELVHFSICGDWLTDRVRDLWIENEHEKALAVLDEVIGLTMEQKEQIVTGKKRFTGINDLDFIDDDATHHCGIKLLSLREVIAQQKRDAAEEVQYQQDVEATRDPDEHCIFMSSPWGLVPVPMHVTRYVANALMPRECAISWEEYQERFPAFVADALDRNEDEEILAARGATALRIAASHKTGELPRDILNPNPPPGAWEDDTPQFGSYKDSQCGWVLPTGQFYPCCWAGHAALLGELDKTEEDVEKTWLKISMGPMSAAYPFHFYTLKRLTKKQISFIWDYCEYHKIPYPKDQIEEFE